MDIVREAKNILERNRRTTEGHQYTVPSSEHYPYQWLWDSCFHAIILAQYDAEAAKAELRALFAKQFADGFVPHIIYWTPGVLHLFRWGVEGTSSLTQPPMIAYAAWEIHRRTGDKAFLESIYRPMLRYYNYLIFSRDPRGHHLIGIINPDESGEDNSPRFDAPLGASAGISIPEHLALRTQLVDRNRECDFDIGACMRDFFWVKDVPFNAILIENLHALGHIASLLEDEEGEQFCKRQSAYIEKAMRERMFEDGVFWATSGTEYQKLKVHTWAHFAPLFAGLYSSAEARRLVEEEFNNEKTFCAPYGLRTVSKQEPSYRPDGFWRGPVWMAPHWFAYRGLVRYGFKEEAKKLREKSEACLQKSGFREYFDPETGEGYGAENFTWGALVLAMMEE